MDSSTYANPVHEPPPDESVRAGHEIRDVNIRVLLWLGATVAGVIVVVLVMLQLLLHGLEVAAVQSDPELSPLSSQPATAAPRLQDTPVHDYLEYRQQQEERLNVYGWIDREKQIVHVPVSRAMELMLKEGLPDAAEQPDSDADTKEAPGEQETNR